MLHKIYPPGVPNQPQNVFKLVFLAEAFTVSERKSFYDACQYFVQEFLETPPFNLTKIDPHWINVYAGFQASNQSGPTVDSSPTGRSVYESTFNSAERTFDINQEKVNEVINDSHTTLPFGNDAIELATQSLKGHEPTGATSTLVVLLIPPVTGEPSTLETESTQEENDYHYIATTINNFWVQVVFRSIAKRLGLGDEYELPGDEYLSPENGQNDVRFPNLQYFKSLPVNNRSPELNWRQYFSIGEKILPAVFHRKTGETLIPDTTIDTVPVSYSSIEFWEGGGGYRTGVYRSAKDCLMRRKLGDPLLPVSEQRVPFCKVCKMNLKGLIG